VKLFSKNIPKSNLGIGLCDHIYQRSDGRTDGRQVVNGSNTVAIPRMSATLKSINWGWVTLSQNFGVLPLE